MSFRKYVILHGQCIVALIIAGIILTPFFFWKIYQIKKNYKKLHISVSEHERRITELEGK
jgi:hypothetical protein